MWNLASMQLFHTTTDNPPHKREPNRWGLPNKAVRSLAKRLSSCWERFQPCFQTMTRNTSHYAFDYVSALLRMDTNRNFAQIGRNTHQDPQNIQHFMTNSPWSARAVLQQVQHEIANTPQLLVGSVLLLDESGEEKASAHTVGCARQYNGRQGKVDMSQMGVFLAYANLDVNLWTWVDGQLYFPKEWFAPQKQPLRDKLGVPKEQTFAKKWEIGLAMIRSLHTQGLPFDLVACDAHYGQCNAFRAGLAQRGIGYCADIPADTQVYGECPEFGSAPGKDKGCPGTPARVLDPSQARTVAQIAQDPNTVWQTLCVRPTERGYLQEPFACVRVWTLREGSPVQEWLILRQESSHKISYALANASPDASLAQLAEQKCVRYFVERGNQDAKSELGFDEFCGQKYRAWEHHLALTVLASWFVAQTKLDFTQSYPRDGCLASEWEVDVLPALSTANVRELLRAVMPLPQLSEEEAAALVVQHLVNRVQSRKSRLKHSQGESPPN